VSVLAATTIQAMGTTATVAVADQRSLDDALGHLVDEIGAMDSACSRFRADSEITQVNSAAGREVAVSPLLLEAIEIALRAAAITGGAVDPTVGSAVRVIGYDRDYASVAPVGPVIRWDLRPVPGWQVVELDRRRSTVKVPCGVELDLGATAKAFCTDRAAALAARAVGSGVLVSLGGDVSVAGDAPEGGWVIQVTDNHADPLDAGGPTVSVSSGGLATSSTTVRRWKRGDRAYHHLIDPTTGGPAEEFWRTVTVAAASCVDANIASTAAIVLGKRAADWLQGRRLPARLVQTDGTVVTVGGWPEDPEPEINKVRIGGRAL
jgi:FAD:protein FMN transferase